MADTDPNVGIGTPVTGGAPTGTSAVHPIPYTLLSLPRYARVMGINPVHFQGGFGNDVWPLTDNCSDIWPSRSWQRSDAVSREDLATAILGAEADVARVLGYWPAATWISNEMHPTPKFYRNDLVDGGGRQFATSPARKSVMTRYKKVISGGRRAVTLIDSPSVGGGDLVYSDEDSDGFIETATITVTTTVTDTCELKAYFPNKSGAREWEIRDPRSVTISGGVGTLVFDAWLFIEPEIQMAYPTHNDYVGICLDTIDNYVDTVDVYREYNDIVSPQAQFFWEPGESAVCSSCALTINGSTLLPSGSSEATGTCTECGFTAQDGCLLVRDFDTGQVVPAPGTYDATLGKYTISSYAIGRDPDIVKIWYRAGDVGEARLAGYSCDSMSHFYAETIAWIATARLERPPCACGNLTALFERLRERPTSKEIREAIDFGVLGNPIGTLRGELMAWSRLSRLGEKIYTGHAI